MYTKKMVDVENDSGITTALYKLSQEGLMAYIKYTLKYLNISYTEYKGNIYGIRFNGEPIFSAHMDTVDDKDMKKELVLKNGKLSRIYGILGADDRAGVNIILNNIKDINFLFTKDEEIGCIGASSLVNNEDFLSALKDNEIPACIILDRKGNSDIIGSNNFYCEEDLENDIIKAFPSYRAAIGVYCDADVLNEVIPCVNISIGYYNQHTMREYLQINEWEFVNKNIHNIINATKGKKYRLPDVSLNKYLGYSYEKNKKHGITLWDDYLLCSNKGCTNTWGMNDSLIYVKSLDMYLCDECLEALIDELSENFLIEEVV